MPDETPTNENTENEETEDDSVSDPVNIAVGCTGLTTLTPQRLQLDAGVFFENLLYSSATNAATFKTALDTAINNHTSTTTGNLLGATRGGGTFVATPTTREPEIDGKRHRTKGLIRYDTWDIRLTGTMVEAYPGNFKRALGPADVSTSGSIDTLTLRTQVTNTDYIDHVQWVTLLGDGTYMVIELDNVINLDGVTFTFQDKNEGTIPFNFAATQGALTGTDNAPFRIKYFHPAT